MKKAVITGLAGHRVAQKMSVHEVCAAAQISDKTLRRMERGKEVGLPICQRVAKLLRLPANSVVPE